MRARRIGLVVGLVVLAAMPLTSACYAPRIESCRDPIRDFSGISSVQVVNPTRPFGFFEGGSEEVSFTVSATTTMASGTCVQVRSELRDSAGGLVEVLDTPIRASVTSGVLTTTPIFHYHASSLTPMTLHVTALGATIDATVFEPRFADMGVRISDAAVRDSGVRDAGVRDAGTLDAGAGDAGDGDAGDAALDAGDVDGSTVDGSTIDGSTDDAAAIDAAIDAGP